MAKLFSFASWNVEHFVNNRDRIKENIQFISESNPDVFAVFEVEGKDVFGSFVELMPTHNFFITEDLSKMATLVGVNRQLTAFVTQRQELKSKVPTLRPGALITLTIKDEYYSVLFVHMKSSPDPHSWGLRDDMIGHVLGLKRALDKTPGAPPHGANFICMGDLNTMGMNVTYSDKDMTGAEELERYVKRFKPKKVRLLSKTSDYTWWGGSESDYPPSNLDHVLASDSLNFREFDGMEILVRGWPELPTEEEQTNWIKNHSDHAMLYGEVHD